ncbi:MAG: acyl carrier protein [Bacillota bacterium]
MAGKDPIFQKVREIIAEQLSIDDEDEISLDSTFINDLGADSLDIVELIMALEEEFGLEIPDEDAEKINTVADVVEYIRERTK